MERVIQYIMLGFTPPTMFKRGAWTDIERVMEFLCNEGLLVRTASEVKYSFKDGSPITRERARELAERYMSSPLYTDIDRMKHLSAQHNLPLNSKELLDIYKQQ